MTRTRLSAVATAFVAMAMAVSAPAYGSSDKPPLEPPPWTGALPGAGAPPGGFTDWADLMRLQAKLDDAADRISALGEDGQAGFVVSAETRRLRVYWKGRTPSRVNAVIQELRRDVTIDVLAARFSEKEMVAAAKRVARQPGVTAVAPDAEGRGLQVSVKGPQHKPSDSVPVVKTDVAEPAPSYSRWNDSAPYWGGAVWSGPAGRCSTGFGIWIGGASKMLSAGHCAANNDNAYDGGGDYMGTVSGDNNAYDRLYINAYSAGRIYDGGVGSGEFSKPVVGASHSYVGDWLCTSGAYSGALCDIRVVAVNQTIYFGYYVYQTVRAEQINRYSAGGNGDSGGPVFSLASDPSKVIAKGTISAGDPTYAGATCTGVPASASRRCSWRIWYVDVVNSLNAYGASIITG